MFWEKFMYLCDKTGKKPNNVASELGCSSGSVTAWKQGRIPRASTVNDIADYFGVTSDYLLGRTSISNVEPVSIGSKVAVKIPVYGKVAAGVPIEAIEDVLDYEEISEDMAKHGEYFALKINGHSMEPRIYDGDVVIVRRQPDVENGEIAIVMVDGSEATCKKIIKQDIGISLVSLNPAYEPMFYTIEQIENYPVTILGKVVELRGKF